MRTEAQKRAQKKYREGKAKDAIKQYRFDLWAPTDADVIERLDAQPSKAGYIKKLIRDDIASEEELKTPCQSTKNEP